MIVGLYASTMQSGKSEVAKVLVEEFGFTVVKFAGPLKDMTKAFLKNLGFDTETAERMIEGDLKEKPLPGLEVTTPRAIMQTIGTEWGRGCIDKDVWVRVAIQLAIRLNSCGRPVVIDDLRFPNEFSAVRCFGSAARVIRPGHSGPTSDHPSEGLLDNQVFDYEVRNDGSLEELRDRARRLADVLGVPKVS